MQILNDKKYHYTLSYIINQIDSFKRAIQKAELFHSDIAGGGKILKTLKKAQYVF